MPSARNRVLESLRSLTGKQTIAGIHNREPNPKPSLQTDRITALVGRTPGLWSGDFLFSKGDVANRWTMVREARRQWEAGSLVNIMAHVAPPGRPDVVPWEGGIMSHLDDRQWRDLTTTGGTLHAAWLARLDDYAKYLAWLAEAGVVVLWRPLHEMNQGKFWWGGRPGPGGTAKLWRITHDHLTRSRGLDNLIWVWDVQDLSTDLAAYDPGPSYRDVVAFDIYDQGWRTEWYERVRRIAGDAPMAIGECDRLPTPEYLRAHPQWCFFMSWAELTFEKNSEEEIRALYRDPRVITRERLPRFRDPA